MWEYVELPEESSGPEQREDFVRQFAEEKMREYDDYFSQPLFYFSHI